MRREQLNNLRHGPSTHNTVTIITQDGHHYPTNGANIIREAKRAGLVIIGSAGPTERATVHHRSGKPDSRGWEFDDVVQGWTVWRRKQRVYADGEGYRYTVTRGEFPEGLGSWGDRALMLQQVGEEQNA